MGERYKREYEHYHTKAQRHEEEAEKTNMDIQDEQDVGY